MHVLHISDLHFGHHHWATDERGEGHVASLEEALSCLFENHQDHYGYIGKSQLDRLAALLKGSAHRYRVVAMHHHLLPIPAEAIPPDPGDAATTLDVSLVRDGGVALRRFGQLGVQIVLHGHKHDPLRRFHCFAGPRERGIHILGAGSAGVHVTELPPQRPHHAQILTLDKGPVLTELTARDYEWKLGPPDLLFHSYDELDYLEEKLAQRSVEGTMLLDLVRRGAKQQSNWLDKSARDVMEAIKRAGATPKQVEGAYWWLIVYGVLRFKDDNFWWTKQTWDGSVDRAMLPPRGRLLLSRL